MATALEMGVEAPVTLAATVEQLTGIDGAVWLLIWESDVDLYIVTGTADGEALPSTGRRLVPTTILPFAYDISPYGLVGLAGDGAGTARVEARR